MYERIIALCKLKDISVRKLEQELGFSNGTINHWKKHDPPIKRAAIVARYFGISLDALVDWSSLDESEE